MAEDFPLTEKFFLGGEGTVRGYSPGKIGPHYEGQEKEPTGGISSTLLSMEYSHTLAKPIDVFTFFDAGTITQKRWSLSTFKTSVGFGVRLDIGRRLPFIFGVGFPLNPDNDEQVSRFFFSMAGRF